MPRTARNAAQRFWSFRVALRSDVGLLFMEGITSKTGCGKTHRRAAPRRGRAMRCLGLRPIGLVLSLCFLVLQRGIVITPPSLDATAPDTGVLYADFFLGPTPAPCLMSPNLPVPDIRQSCSPSAASSRR